MSAFIKTASSYVQGARTLGREYYTSAGIFAREINRIFPSRWLCVGREEQIAQPGEFFVQAGDART